MLERLGLPTALAHAPELPATRQMQELAFAELDLGLHDEAAGTRSHGDVEALALAHVRACTPCGIPPDHGLLYGMRHLFVHPDAYSAGLYAYSWCRLLVSAAAAKASGFTFQHGRVLRTKVLRSATTRDPAEAYADFAGLPPDPDALIRQLTDAL
jgi:Zn-dependent oligopeptidase